MKGLKTDDWKVLSHILYKVYATQDMTIMRKEFLEQIHLLMDFDGADFWLVKKEKGKEKVSSVSYHCEDNAEERYKWSKKILQKNKNVVCHMPDEVGEEGKGQLEPEILQEKIYTANQWQDSLHMGIFAEDATPGMMAFYRKEGEAPFDGEDMALLEMLREHFELRLQQNAREVHGNSDGKLTIRGAVERYDLTKREETILRLLMQGVERDKICEQLVISVNTLKKHMGNIYRKLGIKNRVQMFKMIREKE